MNKNKKKIRASVLLRIALLFLCALLMAAACTFAVCYKYVMNSVETGVGEIAEAAATSVMTAIGSREGLDALYKDEALRDEVHKTFRFICRRDELRYLYLYTVDGEEVRHYVISAASSDDDDALIQEKRGFGVSQDTPLLDAEKKVLSKASDDDFAVVDSEFGKTYVYILPVANGKGEILALIGADFSMENIRSRAVDDLKIALLPGLLVLAITYVLALLLIGRSVIRPIKALSEQMKSFIRDRKSNTSAPKREAIYEDEISDIENSFDKMKQDIGQYVSDIETLTSKTVYNQTQLDVARNIQNGIVPEEYSLTGDHFEAYGCVKAAREVGGDFYDIFALNDTHICVVIGDICGKSISAALFMVMVKTAIRDQLRAGLSLAEALNLVNQTLCVSNPENMFATVLACVLDTETGRVTYANAGHERPLVLGREPYYLEMNNGMAIGLFEDAGIEEEEILLGDGEGLLLYTDGIPEAINREQEQFGFDRLKAAAVHGDADRLNPYDARALAGDVTGAVRAFAEGTEQFDDITCLALIYNASGSESRKLSPDIAAFAAVKKTIFSSLGESENTRNIILACEEIFSNIVNYSGADQVAFSCRRSGDTWFVTFIDNGTPFDPVKTKRKEPAFEDLEFGGMGIKLARTLSKDMVYNRVGVKNVLTMTFAIDTEQ